MKINITIPENPDKRVLIDNLKSGDVISKNGSIGIVRGDGHAYNIYGHHIVTPGTHVCYERNLIVTNGHIKHVNPLYKKKDASVGNCRIYQIFEYNGKEYIVLHKRYDTVLAIDISESIKNGTSIAMWCFNGDFIVQTDDKFAAISATNE